MELREELGGRGERMERRNRGGGLKRTLVDSKIRDGEGLQARMARGELRDIRESCGRMGRAGRALDRGLEET